MPPTPSVTSGLPGPPLAPPVPNGRIVGDVYLAFVTAEGPGVELNWLLSLGNFCICSSPVSGLMLGVPGMPCCEAVEIRCGPDRGNRDSKPTASS
jgi:hypothetical protein